jgi:molecular chaperone DnaJ
MSRACRAALTPPVEFEVTESLTDKRDYYDVLGVARDADDAELKRAFRELARRYHPDINPGESGAEDHFKEINEAYAVLSNARSRARYDRYGFTAVQGAVSAREEPGAIGSVVEAVDELLGDIIGDVWRRRRQRRRGRDLCYTLEISFEEAIFGCTKTIHVPGHRQPDGTTGEQRTFSVTIPPATKDGAIRTIKNEGEPGSAGGQTGDLHVIVRVREHPLFRRENFDVWCEVPLSFAQAALGSLIEVPTIDAKVRMRIPEGTQSGRVFRLRGKGIPKSSSKNALRGDHLVKIVVETPTGLTPRQRELLEEFARESGDAIAHPRTRGFLDKLKALFQE